jgi:hypothetical protein
MLTMHALVHTIRRLERANNRLHVYPHRVRRRIALIKKSWLQQLHVSLLTILMERISGGFRQENI